MKIPARFRMTLLAAALAGPAVAIAGDARLAALFDGYWQDTLLLEPLTATAIGDHRFDDRLPNWLTPDHRAASAAHLRAYLDALHAIDRAGLEHADRVSYDVLENDLELAIAGQRFPDWMIPHNQFWGITADFAQLASGQGVQPFRTTRDYEAFLSRMDAMDDILDRSIANMRIGMASGVTQPKVVMQGVLAQLEALIVEDPRQNLFRGAIGQMPAAIPPADRQRLAAAWDERIARIVNPALVRLRDFVRDEYLPQCRDSVGLLALPDGRAWYAWQVRQATTLDMEPEDIHRLGLSEVARIRGEMEQVMREVGFEGGLNGFFAYLRSDARFRFATESELIESYRAAKRKVDRLVPRLFDLAPAGDYELRIVEPYRAPNMAGAFYEQGTADGKRPGVFYLNTHDLAAQPRYGVETLSVHEAVPGHHFQIQLQLEMDSLPDFRRFGQGYVAFAEGWALYAESIGREMGMFSDPYQYYGKLAGELMRAMRLVVDTGLHAKGWTREQAIAYMLETSSMAESEVTAEVERYIAIPGQALGYKLGQLHISALRDRAQRELGARFDLRAFHREVLRDGSVPMRVLDRKIDAWIAASAATPGESIDARASVGSQAGR